MEWLEFITAGVCFLIAHRIPTIPIIRAGLMKWMSAPGFTIAYSILSVILLVWLFKAAAEAPYVELWGSTAWWQIWLPAVLMDPACLLAAFVPGIPNPLSFGGSRNEQFNPDKPGIVGVARHGLLVAILLWSFSHMIANGELAHVILFGSAFVFGIYGMVIIDRRKQQQLGLEQWRNMARLTSFLPFQSMMTGEWRPNSLPILKNTLPRFSVAILLYVVLVFLHPYVIGVNPIPQF